MTTKNLVTDYSCYRQAVKHIVDQFVKQTTQDGAECQCALVMKAAGAILPEPPAEA
jgi:hypothetical protein